MNRVLHLVKGLGKGGAEQLLASASDCWNSNRFEYEVAYLLPWKDALVPELRQRQIRLHCLSGNGRDMRWPLRLRSLVRNRGIDLVHAHSPFMAVGARTRIGRVRPLVYTEHNMWERYRWATYWGNALTYSRNDFVFAVSDRVRSSIQYPAPLRFRHMPPVETLRHGINPNGLEGSGQARDVRKELAIPDDAPVVGTVANLKAHKGLDVLLKAAVRVRRRFPSVRFVVVGQGPCEQQLRRLADQLSLDGTLVLTGYRSDATRVARAFDAFVLSSLYEGFPLALIEAMALGKAPVATRVGGIPEIVEDRKNGLLVPARDPEALASAITKLLLDQKLRTELGEAARCRAADFNIEKAVRRMEQVYEDLLR